MVSCLELQRWAGSIRLLAIGLALTSCGNSERMAPPADGTLIVSTSTVGDDPDQDGFRLTIDGVDSVVLRPTDRIAVTVPVGRHALELVGVAEQCSVAPSTPLDVDIAVGDPIPVAFAIDCALVGAAVTIGTTGMDPDPDGYRTVVDGIDRGPIPTNGSAFIHAEPGSRTITLTGLAPNCGFTGPASQTVTTIPGEATPVEFAIRCTATTGVINVSFTPSGTDVEGTYQVIVDGLPQYPTGPGAYGIYVPGGDHLVYVIAPPNCTVKPGPQSVNVTVGGLTRDTVQAPFTVHCIPNEGTLRITAPTTGPLPNAPYHIGLCDDWYCYYGATFLGDLTPNDTLVVQVPGPTGVRILEVTNLPPNCVAQDPSIQVTVAIGDTLDVAFPVSCSP